MEVNNMNNQMQQTATQVTPINQMKNLLANKGINQMFEQALKMNAGAFISSLIDLYNSDGYLQKCEPKDVAMEALKAATLNLPINKGLGFAYIVPYGKAAQFQIGYKGYIQLAMRTGQYKHINAGAVYEGEEVKENRLAGTVEILGDKKNDNETGYFAYFKLTNGFEKCLYMSKQEMTTHAQRFSKAFKNGPWQSDFSAMATKTVLRLLLSKYGVLSTQMQEAIAKENDEQLQQQINQNANKEVIDIEKIDNKNVIDIEAIDAADDDIEAPF